MLPIHLKTTDTMEEMSMEAMVDTGATGDFIDQDFVTRAKLPTRKLSQLVFGSPVQSGLLTPRAIDCNCNWSFLFWILEKTGPNRCGPVHIGFLRLQDWLTPVTV